LRELARDQRWWWGVFFFFFFFFCEQPQVPPLQRICLPFPQSGQTLPHVPQLDGLLPRSAQTLLQSINPAGHFGVVVHPQVPPVHVATPPVQAGQTLPHVPQFEVLLLRSMHVPLQSN
jgi:hypothetical protein